VSGRNDPQQALLAINRALASGIGSYRVFGAIVEGAREAFAAERGVLLLGNEPVAHVGGDEPEWSRSVVQWVRTHGEPLLSVDAPDDPRIEKSQSVFQANVRSVMAAPMHVDGDVEGVIYLAAQQRLRDFGANDLQVLAAFADQAALTFKIAALKRELERRTQETEELTKLAERDGLTGLLNRRAFDRTLAAALAARQGPLALILLDIDLFKNFNDRYGHPTGDDLLRAAARMLEREVRATKQSDGDIVARVGGEEFAVLLTETGPVAARQVAERIRTRFTRLHEASEIPLPTATSASFGIACAPFHGSDPETLLKSADRALYRAKEGGRNRVDAATPADAPRFGEV
jgi:diguanylate cyclase (GGDEF)-like protein